MIGAILTGHVIWTILSIVSVMVFGAALAAGAITATVYRGFPRSWPLVLFVALYLFAWFLSPPPPMVAAELHYRLTLPDFARYTCSAAALVWLFLDYLTSIKTAMKRDRECKEAMAEVVRLTALFGRRNE